MHGIARYLPEVRAAGERLDALALVVGKVLCARKALLPALPQGGLGYPVGSTGEVMAPRGIGTLLAMLTVGRLVQRVDSC